MRIYISLSESEIHKLYLCLKYTSHRSNMFPLRKKKEETSTVGSNSRPSQAEIKAILRTVPYEQAFYFFEGLGKPTKHFATGLVDFRDKINNVSTTSLLFHLKRKDFENWIREVLRDSELARRISTISPLAFDWKTKLYTTISTRIRELRERLPISTATTEDLSVPRTTPV